MLAVVLQQRTLLDRAWCEKPIQRTQRHTLLPYWRCLEMCCCMHSSKTAPRNVCSRQAAPTNTSPNLRKSAGCALLSPPAAPPREAACWESRKKDTQKCRRPVGRFIFGSKASVQQTWNTLAPFSFIEMGRAEAHTHAEPRTNRGQGSPIELTAGSSSSHTQPFQQQDDCQEEEPRKEQEGPRPRRSRAVSVERSL